MVAADDGGDIDILWAAKEWCAGGRGAAHTRHSSVHSPEVQVLAGG